MNPQGNSVALGGAMLLAHQVHPKFGVVRLLAQVVVPYQAVEVDRAGQADVTHIVGNLGNLSHGGLEFAQGGIGSFERGPLLEVQHQQQLVLVVEREHFQGHHAHGRQAGRGGREQGNDQKK